MSGHEALQFGEAEPGVVYKDRPAAFGIALRDGRVALVRVSKPGQRPWYDLPGGALDHGETDAQALVREFGEETGLIVRPRALVVRACQRFRKADDEPVNNRSGHYVAEITGEDQALKIEEDHELVWLEPSEALVRMRHDSHAWALLAWLRTTAA